MKIPEIVVISVLSFLVDDASNFKSTVSYVSEKLEAWAETAHVGDKLFWLECWIKRVA